MRQRSDISTISSELMRWQKMVDVEHSNPTGHERVGVVLTAVGLAGGVANSRTSAAERARL